MLGNFVTAGTAIIDGAFFKESIVVGQGLLAIFRGEHAVLPIKIYEGQVDAGNTLFLIGAENALVVNAVEAFKVRPVFAQLLGEIFEHGDTHIAADSKENDIAQMRSGGAIFLHNML